jgi:hypothetical protein
MSHIQVTDLAPGSIELDNQASHIYGGRFQLPSRILPSDGSEFVPRPRPISQPAPRPVSDPPPGFTIPLPGGGFAAGGTNPFGSPDFY